MKIKRDGFLLLLFTRGTARWARGVSFAAPGVLFSFNPRGLVAAVRFGDRWRFVAHVWWPGVAKVAA